MPKSGQVVVDTKHAFEIKVFRGSTGQRIVVSQNPNGEGFYNSPNMVVFDFPTNLDPINAEAWANALLKAASKERAMNEYTGRRSTIKK